jgi:integrase
MPQTKKFAALRPHRIKRADGTTRTYFYNSKTGDAYGTDQAIAEARFAEYLADCQPKGQAIGGPTLEDATQLYLKSNAFNKVAPRTQVEYRRTIEQLRVRFGAHRLDSFTLKAVEKLQDELKNQPSKCYHTLNGLHMVLLVAIKEGLIPGPSPISKLDERIRPAARTEVWSHEQIETFIAAARPSLRLAARLLFYTAQRPSDVLAMTKRQIIEIDGRLHIRLRQQKTGSLIDVPVHGDLLSALRARMAETTSGEGKKSKVVRLDDLDSYLVPSPTGLQWTRRNFSRAWDIARIKAKLPPVQRRDLRRTAVVDMAIHNLETVQIAAITGHSLNSVESILKVYLPRRTDVALAGIKQWETAPSPAPQVIDNVVRLAAPAKAKRGKRR